MISGNGNGVVLGFGAIDNSVAGNVIGLASDGVDALPNSGDGVQIVSDADNNTIGGVLPAQENIISGNGLHGVEIDNASSNTVAENFIGTLADGETPRSNAQNGVEVQDSTNNTIGGTNTGGGNVISGNSVFGIEFSGSSNNLVINNTIGMTADLSAALGNGLNGINVVNGSTANTIGGSGVDMGNRVVCTHAGLAAIAVGNTGDGSNGNLIQGNTINLNSDGSYALGAGNGIYIGSDHNTVGGTTDGARNDVVGASGYTAIWLNSAGSFDNLIQGNYVGTTADGSSPAGGGGGIAVDSAHDNTIGGSAVGAGNVISGNSGQGLDFQNAYNNVVAGNFIGTDATGSFAVANGSDGIRLEQGSANNTIGGAVAGLRNVISGNGGDGVFITGQGTSQNIVAGNFVGTDASGTSGVGNDAAGVYILNSGNNTIGGTTSAARNIISANGSSGYAGIDIYGSSGNLVERNYIGTEVNGFTALGNAKDGITIFGGSTANTIGGTAVGAGNVISGNKGDGVVISGQATSGNIIAGNFVGTDAAGTSAVGNAAQGIGIDSGATNNTVGGVYGAGGNVISGNLACGINVTSNGTSGNVIEGNLVGTDVAGSQPLSNAFQGIYFVREPPTTRSGAPSVGPATSFRRTGTVASGSTVPRMPSSKGT